MSTRHLSYRSTDLFWTKVSTANAKVAFLPLGAPSLLWKMPIYIPSHEIFPIQKVRGSVTKKFVMRNSKGRTGHQLDIKPPTVHCFGVTPVLPRSSPQQATNQPVIHWGVQSGAQRPGQDPKDIAFRATRTVHCVGSIYIHRLGDPTPQPHDTNIYIYRYIYRYLHLHGSVLPPQTHQLARNPPTGPTYPPTARESCMPIGSRRQTIQLTSHQLSEINHQLSDPHGQPAPVVRVRRKALLQKAVRHARVLTPTPSATAPGEPAAEKRNAPSPLLIGPGLGREPGPLGDARACRPSQDRPRHHPQSPIAPRSSPPSPTAATANGPTATPNRHNAGCPGGPKSTPGHGGGARINYLPAHPPRCRPDTSLIDPPTYSRRKFPANPNVAFLPSGPPSLLWEMPIYIQSHKAFPIQIIGASVTKKVIREKFNSAATNCPSGQARQKSHVRAPPTGQTLGPNR
ncbi:hypothetical protein EYB25_010096 [Talaromyces marneffei]|nr:hypothetical protein EYB25_010096 [Talaromyces marneffei]